MPFAVYTLNLFRGYYFFVLKYQYQVKKKKNTAVTLLPVRDLGPLADHLLQLAAVLRRVVQQGGQARPRQEPLLHIVVRLHPDRQLAHLPQRVRLQQGADPAVVEGHPARHHLVGPVGDGERLQVVGGRHQQLHQAAVDATVEVQVAEGAPGPAAHHRPPGRPRRVHCEVGRSGRRLVMVSVMVVMVVVGPGRPVHGVVQREAALQFL
jgi:hypothetical protein